MVEKSAMEIVCIKSRNLCLGFFFFFFGSAGYSLLNRIFSPVAVSGAYSLVVAHGLLIVVSSLVAEHRLGDLQAFRSCGSLALKHRLNSCASGASRSAARGIFLDRG